MEARTVALALLLVCWSGRAWAYRPFDGTDADVAPLHEVELEVGPVGYQRQGSEHYLVVPALVLNYGVAPGFELVLGGRQQWARASSPRSQLDDVSLSLKSVLRRGSRQGAQGVSVAVEAGPLLPGTQARLGAHLASIFSWQWPAFTLHLNLSNDLLTSVDYAASVGAILEGPDRWLVRPVAELMLERDFRGHSLSGGSSPSALLGAIASINDAWAFDVAWRRGASQGLSEDELRLGFTWSFEVAR